MTAASPRFPCAMLISNNYIKFNILIMKPDLGP